MKTAQHPRRPIAPIWAGFSLAATAALLALRGLGLLPLPYVHEIPAPGWPAALAIALVSGATLMLPLSIWIANPGQAQAILRPTKGKILCCLGLSLLVPGMITESGRPFMLGPLYLFLALTNPSVTALAGVLIFFPLACAVLYPTVAALIWGLERKARPAALLGLPIGLYGLLYLMGGTF